MTFLVDEMTITKTFLFVNNLSDTFDDFADDLIASEIDLLKDELDFLLFQNLFNSIDLNVIKSIEFIDNDSMAA